MNNTYGVMIFTITDGWKPTGFYFASESDALEYCVSIVERWDMVGNAVAYVSNEPANVQLSDGHAVPIRERPKADMESLDHLRKRLLEEWHSPTSVRRVIEIDLCLWAIDYYQCPVLERLMHQIGSFHVANAIAAVATAKEEKGGVK